MNSFRDQVILVDKDDHQIGLMDKLKTHKGEGKLHRAVSVLLYRKIDHRHPELVSGSHSNNHIEFLLQKRASTKPTWPGFWSNTVCTHPLPGESPQESAVRRLKEELGINCPLPTIYYLLTFTYQAKYNEQYSENEVDHVFMGQWNGKIFPNSEEVAEVKWMGLEELKKDISQNPNQYTPWFKIFIDSSSFVIPGLTGNLL